MLNVSVSVSATESEHSAIVSMLESLLTKARAGEVDNLLVFTEKDRAFAQIGMVHMAMLPELCSIVDSARLDLLHTYAELMQKKRVNIVDPTVNDPSAPW